MATNYTQAGEIVTIIAPSGGVVSGVGVLVGSLFGIAQISAAEGASVEIATCGVYTHAKTSAQAWTAGALIYWDNTNKLMTTTVVSNKLIGVALAAAANPSPAGSVRLNGAFVG